MSGLPLHQVEQIMSDLNLPMNYNSIVILPGSLHVSYDASAFMMKRGEAMFGEVFEATDELIVYQGKYDAGTSIRLVLHLPRTVPA